MTFLKHFTTYFVAHFFLPRDFQGCHGTHFVEVDILISKFPFHLYFLFWQFTLSPLLFFSTNSVAMAGQKTLQLFILFMVLILLMEEAKLIDARLVRSRKRRSNYKPKKPSITELAKKVQELEDRLAEIEGCKRKSDILH